MLAPTDRSKPIKAFIAVALATLLSGCGLGGPERALSKYERHKAAFNDLIVSIDACRPKPGTMHPWGDAPVTCLRPGGRADTIRPQLRKLGVKYMMFEDSGNFRVFLTVESAGISVSSAEWAIVYSRNQLPPQVEPGDGEVLPADAADKHWYLRYLAT